MSGLSSTDPARTGGATAVRRRLPTKMWTCLALLAVYGLFLGLCLWRHEPAFLSAYNLKTLITHTVIVGIGALGMTLLIISGNMDLSVGSLIALTTVVTALVLKSGGASPGLCWTGAAALAGILAATAGAALSGLIVSRLRITPFIVTLGMMQIARGVAKWLGENQTVVPPANWLNGLMVVDPGLADPRLSWLVLAPGVWLLLLLTVLVHLLLRVTVFGRHVYAVGSNPATARLCGVNVEAVTVVTFALGGVFAGLAGVMQFANLTVGDPTAAVGMELDIIAAVVIGGGSLSGGEGSAVGTLIGALLMTVLRNGCTMMGWENYVQNIMVGAVIIGAVAIDSLKHRLRN